MRILSGIQPSGAIHLGNYLGAIQNWVEKQHEDAFYCVVDLHSLTGNIEPAVLNRQTRECGASLLAAGLDPKVCTLFVQSQVPWHAQLSWLLECVATFGELRRMTQFKEKAERQEGYRVGLFTYPVLMASDILLYQTEQVPVGDDQRQHLELTREIAERFNNRYGATFVVPQGIVPAHGARVMDLQDPAKKMSKSVSSPQGTIGVFDDPDDITRKIKRAVTDTDGEVRFDWDEKPGLSNLLEIYAALTKQTPQEIAQKYERYGDLKSDLAETLIASLAPIKQRYNELLRDPAELDRQLREGSEKANVIAETTYRNAAAAMGLLR